MTQTTRTGALPAPLPAILDEGTLLAYVLEYRPPWDALGTALTDRVGAKRADDLIERMEHDVIHDDEIAAARDKLRTDLFGARRAIELVINDLDRLRGNTLYDLEYAESGGNTATMIAMLEDALRNVNLTMALNPCPKPEPITFRREILASATFVHEERAGFVQAKKEFDMGAVATLVADGLGEFARDDDSPNSVKPIVGVLLNERGYLAAIAVQVNL